VENVRPQRRLFLIATEGEKTEPQYFNLKVFTDSAEKSIKIEVIPHHTDSAPSDVLKRMKKVLNEYIRECKIRRDDYAWIIIDKDNWSTGAIDQIFEWSQEHPNRGVAVSNPKFEFWLLLHFNNGDGIISSQKCSEALQRSCPDYKKDCIPLGKFKRENILNAIQRAKQLDNPPCPKWPKNTGTTVYRLVEKLLE